MGKKDDIQQAAERVFYRQGFHGVGIDTIIEEAGVSPRTLYKHFASKDDLAAEVLQIRGRRYVELLQRCAAKEGSGDVAPLFRALKHWLAADAARGCMFFNALAEYKSRHPRIEAVIRDHKAEVRSTVNRYLRAVLGNDPGQLTDHILLLIEGATSQSTISDIETVVARARRAAQRLVDVSHEVTKP